MFDWRTFLDQHRIEYVTSGPNTARDHISIKCPWCGTADPSQHLGISLTGQGWGCLRNHEHRGRSPVRLVATLLHCSYEEAAALTGGQVMIPERFFDRISAMLLPSKTSAERRNLRLPPEFKPIDPSYGYHRAFVNYLHGRGYTRDEISRLHDDYGIVCATSGPFAWRIIFPVYFEQRLITWTGRHVGDSTLRYKTLSVDPEKSAQEHMIPAIGPVTDYFLWYDDLVAANDTIVLCEGPMDALKLRVLARREGVDLTATCFFTAAPSVAQLALLRLVLPRYRRRILLLDRGTLATAIRLQTLLTTLKIQIGRLPPQKKDPGELDNLDFLENLP